MKTGTNMTDPDRLYALLLAAHEGLSELDSARLNARLVLILMNALGDDEAIAQAIADARAGVGENA